MFVTITEGKMDEHPVEMMEVNQLPIIPVALSFNKFDEIKGRERSKAIGFQLQATLYNRPGFKKQKKNAESKKEVTDEPATKKVKRGRKKQENVETVESATTSNDEDEDPEAKKEESLSKTPRKKRNKVEHIHIADDITREELRELIRNYPRGGEDYKFRGSDEFMHIWEQIEDKHFNQGKHFEIKIHQDGHNWREKIGDFKDVHLFLSSEGLGMRSVEELTWDNLHEFIHNKKRVPVIISNQVNRNGAKNVMAPKDLLNAFRNGTRTKILNMISMEIEQRKDILNQKFGVPEFVEETSMVNIVEKALKKEMTEVEEKLRGRSISKTEKMRLLAEKNSFKKQIRYMPKYLKFLLVSMAKSFTDIHIDFSATCVYYHVKKGKKVFYVAPLTPETWRVYQEYEKGLKLPSDWIGTELWDLWQRVEINEGQTAMIPSGYLHFVYTPEDSIVIGGNFLMEQSLQNQFDLTELEEYSIKHPKHLDVGHTFQNFRNLMWSYAKSVLLPNLMKNPSPELHEAAHICLDKMDPNAELLFPWFNKSQRNEIVRQIQDIVPPETAPRRGPTLDAEEGRE